MLPVKQFEKGPFVTIGTSACEFCELCGNVVSFSCPRSVQPVGDLVPDNWKPDGKKVTLVKITKPQGAHKEYIIFSLLSFPSELMTWE
jgi:hypothetical protein